MTEIEKQEIISLHSSGIGYKRIAKQLNISVSSVRTAVLTNEGVVTERNCKNCGRRFVVCKSNSTKQFCSDNCRMTWWNSHQELIIRSAYYHFTCAYCGKEFDSYGNSHRKFCSRKCYTDSLKKENWTYGSGK